MIYQKNVKKWTYGNSKSFTSSVLNFLKFDVQIILFRSIWLGEYCHRSLSKEKANGNFDDIFQRSLDFRKLGATNKRKLSIKCGYSAYFCGDQRFGAVYRLARIDYEACPGYVEIWEEWSSIVIKVRAGNDRDLTALLSSFVRAKAFQKCLEVNFVQSLYWFKCNRPGRRL